MANLRQCARCGKSSNAQFAACPFCGAKTATATDYAAIAERAVEASQPFVALTWHPASALTLDVFFDLNWGAEGVAPNDEDWRPSPQQRAAIVNLGAFYGELVRRVVGGAWQDDPAHPGDPVPARLLLPGGTTMFPVSRAWKRMQSGASESFEFLFVAMRRAAGSVATPAEADGWIEQARYFLGVGRGDVAALFCDRASALGIDAATRSRIDEIRAQAAAKTAEDEVPPPIPEPPAVTPVAPAPAVAAPAEPPFPVCAEALAESVRGGALTQSGDYAGALAAFDSALDFDPAAKEALLGRAGALMSLGRFDEARAWLDSFAGRDDCEPERTLLAAMAADDAGDACAAYDLFLRSAADRRLGGAHRESAASFARGLASDPRVVKRGIERTPELGDAVNGYRRFCEQNPGDADAWREFGVGLTMLGRGDEALPCFDRATALEPGDPKGWDHKAVTLARLKRLDEALAALDAGLRSCPGNVGLRFRRGVLLASAGRRAEARAEYDEVTRADPGHADVWANRADLELREGRTADAAESIERFLRNNPARIGPRMKAAREKLWSLRNPGANRNAEDAQALYERAAGAADLGRRLADLDAAVAADPLLGFAWLSRAECLSRLGRIDEALASCERAESLLGATPDVTDVQVAALLALGRPDDAVACHDRNLACGTPADDRLHAKTRTLLAVGRPADALPIFRLLVARRPFDVALRLERAKALADAGRIDEARVALDAARALGPVPGRP